MRPVLVAFVLLLGLPPAAAVSQAAPPSFSERFSASTRAALTRIVDSARAKGLPSEPLVAKAAEGLLKGADEARIVSAVRALAGHLNDARALLPPSASSGTLTAAASAMRAGVPGESVRELVRVNRGADADLGLALITVTDLAASGVPADRAERAVAALLRRGFPERDLPVLRAAIAHDIASGVAPETALESRLRTIVRTAEGGAPRVP
jgi:hypothetical protein